MGGCTLYWLEFIICVTGWLFCFCFFLLKCQRFCADQYQFVPFLFLYLTILSRIPEKMMGRTEVCEGCKGRTAWRGEGRSAKCLGMQGKVSNHPRVRCQVWKVMPTLSTCWKWHCNCPLDKVLRHRVHVIHAIAGSSIKTCCFTIGLSLPWKCAVSLVWEIWNHDFLGSPKDSSLRKVSHLFVLKLLTLSRDFVWMCYFHW